ncbi:uncharacterized protein EMH_0034160 [Eimeria mitis]|uniref:Uncharacterized protein n=1 Tax=Eimeria mitis TaxID=44415 RepID=U6JUH3_9EIME|nr:uncharacterized protein EMH_0034160 [Eimeria mitis]CDJ27717.1 hypothetical protein, conserved [Eimeria mitis]
MSLLPQYNLQLSPTRHLMREEPGDAAGEVSETGGATGGADEDTPADAEGKQAAGEQGEGSKGTPEEPSGAAGGPSGEGDGEAPPDEQPQEEPADGWGDDPPEDLGPPRDPSSPEEALTMHLVQQLLSPRFADMGAVSFDELRELKELLEGNPTDEVNVGGTPVLRHQLQRMAPGEPLELSFLDTYCTRLQTHVSARASKGLQRPVAILSPKTIVKAWNEFVEHRKRPMLFSAQVRQCKAAERVLLLLPTTPAGGETSDFPPGHIILGVIDMKYRIIRIVDSRHHAPEVYQKSIEFMQLLTKRFADDYSVSPHLPEPGFPFEVEDPQKAARLPAEMKEASGGIQLENLACLAEDRAPIHRQRDVTQIRWRVLAESVRGLQARLLEDGEVRPVEEEEVQ